MKTQTKRVALIVIVCLNSLFAFTYLSGEHESLGFLAKLSNVESNIEVQKVNPINAGVFAKWMFEALIKLVPND